MNRIGIRMLGVVLTGVAVLAGGCCTAGKNGTASVGNRGINIHFDNASFYDKNGKFDVEKGKDAYIALMKYHGYPVYPELRKNMAATDFGTGQFVTCGLGCWMIKNNEEDRYMQMDLYLLPGQILPDHWHVASDKNPAKREGWLVRYGLSHIVGEGEANLGKDVVIPKCHCNGTASVMHDVITTPGQFVCLNRATAHHWQYGGPEGAIITESANVHDDSAVRIADPAMDAFYHAKK